MKYRLYVRPSILAIYEVDAKDPGEAEEKLRKGQAKYVGRDTSDDPLTETEGAVMGIEVAR